MAATDSTLELVRSALVKGNCGMAIQAMETYLAAWPEPQTAERLLQMRTSYELMVGYWRHGGDDAGRGEQYQRLLQQMYVLYANVSHYRQLQQHPYLFSIYTRVRKERRDWSLAAIRSELEGFVSDVAMLQLEPEHKRQAKSEQLYKTHQQWVNQLFEYVLTSRQWSEAVGRQFADMMVTPTIDTVDQQHIVAAVALSVMNQFDMAKFRMLADVYRESQDEHVRQRALVGWVLAMDAAWSPVYPEQRELVCALMSSEQACREVTELQIQFMYSLHEAQDSTTIRSEIMPDLMKNNSFRLTNRGIEEVEDDPMEDILHPDAADQRMEQMEQAYRRMMDMQRQGSDIYYTGFSQMKRFPFYYDIANWLVPFYWQHPDLASAAPSPGQDKVLRFIADNGFFCNSDRYSLVIAFKQVVDRLPQSLREGIQRGELREEAQLMSDYTGTPAHIRRVFVMDLYRFFRLFPHRGELSDPFGPAGDSSEAPRCEFLRLPLMGGTPVEDRKHEVVRLMYKLKMRNAAERLLNTFDEAHHDLQYFLWKRDYIHALGIDGTNRTALHGRARDLFDQGDYEAAFSIYSEAMEHHPEDLSAHLHSGVCLIQMERYQEARERLFRLHYEQPDNEGVKRVLAWTLTCMGDAEQAVKYYEQLTGVEHPVAEDLLNQGYALWTLRRIDEAADSFRRYCVLSRESDDRFVFTLDGAWLAKHQIDTTELQLMLALVDN